MKKYIPKNKFDEQAVERLKALPFEIIRPDVPELLEWLQDLHWPVAHGVAEYLAPHVNDIKQDLLYILSTNDEQWKFGVLAALIAKSPDIPDLELLNVIKRIAEHPTKMEQEEDVDWIAKKIMSGNS